MLERPRDSGARDVTRRLPADLALLKINVPAVEMQRPGEQVEHGALAGAVRADQSENFAGRKIEADIVHRDQAPEPPVRALLRATAACADLVWAGARAGRLCAGKVSFALGSQRATNGTIPLRAYCRKTMNRTENTTISSWPAAPLAISGR